MQLHLVPLMLLGALSSCAALAREGPEVILSTQHHWMILSNASSMDRMHLGDVIVTDSEQVLREWETAQTLWARMQSRTIVMPHHAYAVIAGQARKLSCDNDAPMQAGRLAIEVSGGHGHERTCVVVRPSSCRFVGQIIDRAKESAINTDPLIDLRKELVCGEESADE